ncbi:MAG: RsmE family RNA methyltransferase [Chitinophagales bacterium]|nr:16S rRNA (uracil(1498)-N(3))-methyltransferase [Chitinophagales bacterium]MDW8394409.1 RsmE family RNA methyltransferase [Chitinophagales bacterium]
MHVEGKALAGHLFFAEQINGRHGRLEPEEAHHCLRVLRYRCGDVVRITDGKGKLYAAQIDRDEVQDCQLTIHSLIREEARPLPRIHLAVAPTKNADRFEFLLEKATEAGVAAFTPLLCQRSERKKVALERMQSILKAAVKQSGRLWLPALYPLTPIVSFLNTLADEDGARFIAHCHQGNLPHLFALYRGEAACTVLIGPEGDFSAEEVQAAAASGFSGVSLGPYRLRTETAGLVASLAVSLKYALVQGTY